MESEIAEQPDALAKNAQRYFDVLAERLAGRQFDQIVLVARGSSDNAALYLRYLIEINLHVPVSMAAPSVLTKYGSRVRYRNCLGVGISQSGEATDVLAVLHSLSDGGHFTIGITNSPQSPVAEAVDLHLGLDVGPEVSVAATKTYTASLLAAYQLTRSLGAKMPPPVLPDSEWLQFAREGAKRNAETVVGSRVAFALGRGYSFPTALETALKLVECALIPCRGYSSADFQHGPKAAADDAAVAIVYGELPDGLAEIGMRFILAPEVEDGPAAEIRAIAFGQYLALEAARLRGLDPDRARNLSKITKTL
jgi:glucosamine--fructose-6-phosphate aminotransferase (isomerizing)